MTGRETLTMYARLRGINESRIKDVIESLIKLLLLEEHADKQTMKFRLIFPYYFRAVLDYVVLCRLMLNVPLMPFRVIAKHVHIILPEESARENPFANEPLGL